jgi:hypothetical protein
MVVFYGQYHGANGFVATDQSQLDDGSAALLLVEVAQVG